MAGVDRTGDQISTSIFMKSNFWLLGGLAGLAAASVWAQDAVRDTNPPSLSRLVTGPVAKDVLLDPPALATVKTELIVRSQPAFAGERIIPVVKGQLVTVLEQITLARPKLNEPTNWARITLPTNAAVWVFTDYVDTNTMTISRARVNVRAATATLTILWPGWKRARPSRWFAGMRTGFKSNRPPMLTDLSAPII